MVRAAWVMAPTIELFLRTLQNEQGIFPFAHEMSAKGTILGKPFFSTNQIPTNLTVGEVENSTEIYLADFNELVLFAGPQAEILTSSTGGSWLDIDSSQLTGGFAQDMALIRVVLGRDSQLKHAVSASMIQGITWQ
jgi:HK97 family phage major capsid protein